MKHQFSAFPTVIVATIVAYFAMEAFTYLVPWVQIFVFNVSSSTPLIDFVRLTVEIVCIVTVSSLTARYLYFKYDPVVYAIGPTLFMFYMIVGYGHPLFKVSSLLQLVVIFFLGYKIPDWYSSLFEKKNAGF